MMISKFALILLIFNNILIQSISNLSYQYQNNSMYVKIDSLLLLEGRK